MTTSSVRFKLAVFALLAAVALAFAAANYVRLPEMVGINRYEVTADFADTSGLYPGANVTLRGVDVGKVRDITLTPTGSAVKFSIDDDTQVPVSSEVRITSTSAIGEQYLDIVPQSAGGPFLTNGDVVARSNAVEMPQTAPMLESATALLESVPKDELSDVLTNVSTAFGGSAGSDLETLLNESSLLVETARKELGPTTHLIRSSTSFLATQQDLASETTNSLENLGEFTGQLSESDGDIRRVIDRTPSAARETQSLVEALEKPFPELLRNTSTVARVTKTYLRAMQQILVFLPAIISGAQKGALVAPYGMTQIDFAMNVGNPQPCIKGYLPPDQYQTPESQETKSTPADLACDLPSTSQVSVRGSRNLPCFSPNAVVRRAPSAERCEGRGPSLLPSTDYTEPSLPVLDGRQ